MPIPEREAWEEYRRRKRLLEAERDAGKLEDDAFDHEIFKLAEAMGL